MSADTSFQTDLARFLGETFDFLDLSIKICAILNDELPLLFVERL